MQSPSGINYQVPKDRLCATSRLFVKSFDGAFLENKTRLLRISDTDEDTFNLFLIWLNTKRFPLLNSINYLQQQLLFARLWTFGDTYMIPSLQNTAMRELLGGNSMGVELAHQIAGTAPANSPLEDYMRAQALYDLTERRYSKKEKEDMAKIPVLVDDMKDALGDKAWNSNSGRLSVERPRECVDEFLVSEEEE